MSADCYADVLQETIIARSVPEIFNKDQGSRYTSEVHINVLLNNRVKIFMTDKKRAIDNIFIQRLSSIVKYQDVYLLTELVFIMISKNILTFILYSVFSSR